MKRSLTNKSSQELSLIRKVLSFRNKGGIKLSFREHLTSALREEMGWWITDNENIKKLDTDHVSWFKENQNDPDVIELSKSGWDLRSILSNAFKSGWVRVRILADADKTPKEYVGDIAAHNPEMVKKIPDFIKAHLSECDRLVFISMSENGSFSTVERKEIPEFISYHQNTKILASLKKSAVLNVSFLNNQIDFLFYKSKDIEDKIKLFFTLYHIATKSDVDFETQKAISNKLIKIKKSLDPMVDGGMEKIEKDNQHVFENLPSDYINSVSESIIKEDHNA